MGLGSGGGVGFESMAWGWAEAGRVWGVWGLLHVAPQLLYLLTVASL